MYAFNSINMTLSTALAAFQRFWYAVFSLDSKYFFISILIFLMIYEFFKSVLLNFQVLGDFLFFFLVLISYSKLL